MSPTPQLEAMPESRDEWLRRLARKLRTMLAIIEDRKLRDANPNTVH